MPTPCCFIPFHDLLLTETVRAIEADAPLDDRRALRLAAAASPQREARLVERARELARQPLGLDADLRQVRAGLKGAALLLLVVGALLASSILGGMLDHGRTLNAAAALGVALLPNVVGLPVWIAAVCLARGGEGLLGRALRALARLGWLKHRAPQVLTAASRVLDRHRLTAWAWGGANHALWAVAYLVALAALTFAFGMRAYRLGWETTILTPAFFDAAYRTVAWAPARLGLPVPEAGALAYSGPAASAALAWWLIGGVLVYGLGPRLLALAVCWARWRHGRKRLTLDLSDPYYRTLLNRFDALAPTRVVDVERPAPERAGAAGPAHARPSTGDFDLLAFELPPEVELPAGLLAAADRHWRIDGTRDEREAVLDALADRPPARLLLVCHAGSTPDRGTQRFFAAARVAATALLPLPAAGTDAAGLGRWRAWLDGAGLADMIMLTDANAALDWARPGADHG